MNRKLRIGLLLGVAASAFLVYAHTLHYRFVYDDLIVIVLNPRVHSWHYLPQYFTSNVWNSQGNGYYRPIFMVWLLLNHTLFGLREWGWHLSTVLLHAGASVMTYLLARRLLKSEWAAFAAALLFAVHPSHIESVAWVCGSTDPLLTIFFIGSYLSFLRATKSEGTDWKWIFWSLLLFALALLSKEPAVMLLPVLALHLWLFRERRGPEESQMLRARAIIVRLLPFCVLVLVYLVVRFAIIGSTLGRSETQLSWSTIVLTWPWLFWFYLKKFIWAPPLSAFYDAPYVSSFSSPQFWAPFAVLVIVAAALFLWWRRTRDPLVPWASWWMLLPVLPTLDLRLFTGHEYAHDRYLYLPTVGFCILFAHLLWQVRWPRLAGADRVARMRWATAAVIIALFSAAIWNQSIYWADELHLFERGTVTSPQYGLTALNNVIPHLMAAGRTEEAAEKVQRLARMQPNDSNSQFNAGSILLKLSRYEEAEQYFLKASKLSTPHNSLPLLHIGLTRMKMGKPSEAEVPLRQAVELAPNELEFRYALALDLKQQGRLLESRDLLQQLVQAAPQREYYRSQLEQVQAALLDKKTHAR